MTNKIGKMGMLAAALLAFTVVAVAQHEGMNHQAQPGAPEAQNAPGPPSMGASAPPAMGMMGGMMGGGMMGGGMMGGGMMGMMMGQMSQMTAQHQQMDETMKKMMQSMAAIENEKDPTALKAKIAEHRALMEQMHTQMSQQGGMMQMMMGGMMGASNAPETPKPGAK